MCVTKNKNMETHSRGEGEPQIFREEKKRNDMIKSKEIFSTFTPFQTCLFIFLKKA